MVTDAETLPLPSDRNQYKLFRLTNLHLTLARCKGYVQGHTLLDYEYLVISDIYGNITIPENTASNICYRMM